MAVSDSFCRFFDCITSSFYGYSQRNGSWIIRENDPSASLTELSVNRTTSDFIGFNHNLTKSMPNLTCNRSTKCKDKECDGIAFVNSGANEGLLFVELKSKYDTSPVSTAVEQMCFSFLKMHAMLSLCSGYVLSNMEISFCVATKCAVTENEEAKINQFIDKALKNEDQKRLGSFFRDLFIKGCVSIKLEELFNVKCINLPLHEDIKNKLINVHLVTTLKPNDTKAIFNY